MEMYLQLGSGMMKHCRHLLHRWGGGTVVLSPRDLTPEQLVRFSGEVRDEGGDVVLDPQFYLPHSDHDRLVSHTFWPNGYDTSLFWVGLQLEQLIRSLTELNSQIQSPHLILPGLLASEVDDDWLATQKLTIDAALRFSPDYNRHATVALSSGALLDSTHVEAVIEASERWEVSGYYVVVEPPEGSYLVDNPVWAGNLLDLIAGLKLQGRKVVVGYCNHQMLMASACKADAICSGTWLNVRAFSSGKFQSTEDEQARRAKWYYCPQSLSEYKIAYLDIAYQRGVLGEMAPAPAFDGGYATVLFSGAQPTTVNFSEQSAFRHYLYALHEQSRVYAGNSFDEVISHNFGLLNLADGLIDYLRLRGVRGQQRDFCDSVDAWRAALQLLNSTRGPVLRHLWSSL